MPRRMRYKVEQDREYDPPTETFCSIVSVSRPIHQPLRLPDQGEPLIDRGYPMDSGSIKTDVEKIWLEIDKQISDREHLMQSEQSGGEFGWKTVRLFVSSTFTDFFNEREILVKKVFPELREWCEAKKLTLIECDLRWGVPKDSTTRTTICTCLEEIDRCHEETDGQPFFLNMIGDRYGWVPGVDEVPGDIAMKYSWIFGVSITTMEILHGAYRDKNPNASFFIRNSDYLKDIPLEEMRAFYDDDAMKQEHLGVLRPRLRAHVPGQVYDYSVHVDRSASDSDQPVKVVLTGLDGFAKDVLDFFKGVITTKYGDRDVVDDLSEELQEDELQRMFIDQRAELVIGREWEMDTLMTFTNGQQQLPEEIQSIEGGEQSQRIRQSWVYSEQENRLLIVDAPSGNGKTALLAKLVTVAKESGLDVFHHFVGSTGASFSSLNLLKRLVNYLIPYPTESECACIESDAVSVMHDALRRPEVYSRHLFIVLDDLEQLSDKESSNHLSWLPGSFPGNIHCIVSICSHLPTRARLEEVPCFRMTLRDLNKTSCEEILRASFRKYNKTLDEEQLELLLRNPCARSPLWLNVVYDELRVFGDFALVTAEIRGLPNTLDQLFSKIIARLVTEDETDCMKLSLCLINMARVGLPAEHVPRLLGDIPSKQPAPILHWAQVRRLIKPYIRCQKMGRTERIFFTHNSMAKAVQEELMPESNDKTRYMTHLADYLETWCDDKEMIKSELPDCLMQAGLKARLLQYLRANPDSADMITMRRRQYMQKLRCQNHIFQNMPNQQTIILCMRCNSKQDMFRPGMRVKNSETCVICGEWVSQGRQSSAALICPQHCLQLRMSPGVQFCYGCKMMQSKGQTAFISQAVICHMCSFGQYANMCACALP